MSDKPTEIILPESVMIRALKEAIRESGVLEGLKMLSVQDVSAMLGISKDRVLSLTSGYYDFGERNRRFSIKQIKHIADSHEVKLKPNK